MLKLENITLDFPLPRHKAQRNRSHKSREQVTGGVMWTDKKGWPHVRALDNVSLSLEPGDRLALLGHNGAGKTTLLRVMAGIYAPTKGSVHSNGRIAPILSLNFGLDMEATGLDNIWVRGLFLGMSRAEVRQKIDRIAEFSELGDFLNLPMRTYSSGMRARLAFAISSHVDADILLLDEVVATGDAAFFSKARQQLEGIASQSRIMVLASHSNKKLRELCNKAVLLEHGRIVVTGSLDEVIDVYSREHHTPLSHALYGNTDDSSKALVPTNHERKRVLLINDTGGLPNPGCRAVRKAYKILFRDHIENAVITASVPVNYWMESFRHLAIPGRDSICREKGLFPAAAEHVAGVDISQWDIVRQTLSKNDQYLRDLMESTDLVILNGEGSIHHNSVRALSLLALARTALDAGKKVIMLNATIQAMMPELLLRVLPEFAFIHVREPGSKEFLAKLGIKSYMAPDIAFLALEDSIEPAYKLLDARNHVLVTAGVTVNSESLESIFKAVEAVGMRPVYLSIGDGGEADLAGRVCAEMKVAYVDAAKFGVKELIGFLKQFPCAISGRHHINIFLMRAGVPFVPLFSNTWKIEETLRMIDYPSMPVAAPSDLSAALERLLESINTSSECSFKSYQRGKYLANQMVGELSECS